jgi:hypothetical protein
MSKREFMARITVERLDNHERIDFLGQGETVAACCADGAKNLEDAFRPSSSGAKNSPLPVHVTRADGSKVWRKIEEFEAPATSTAQPSTEVFDV